VYAIRKQTFVENRYMTALKTMNENPVGRRTIM
jgi:hypothetical protein